MWIDLSVWTPTFQFRYVCGSPRRLIVYFVARWSCRSVISVGLEAVTRKSSMLTATRMLSPVLSMDLAKRQGSVWH